MDKPINFNVFPDELTLLLYLPRIRPHVVKIEPSLS